MGPLSHARQFSAVQRLITSVRLTYRASARADRALAWVKRPQGNVEAQDSHFWDEMRLTA